MMLSPDSTLSKSLALLILSVLLAGVWFVLIAPVWQGFSDRLETRTRLEQLRSEYSSRIEPLDALRQQLATAESSQTQVVAGYLPSGNMAAVTSALQTTVRQHLDKSQGRLRSMQILPSSRSENAEKFAVRVDFAIAADKLLPFLYGFDSADPYLFLESVELRSGDTPERAATNQPTQLNMRVDVVGYGRPQMAP